MDITIPNGMEQLSGEEMLACVLFKMIDESLTHIVIGAESHELPIVDVTLMLCDLTRANRMREQPSPATRAAIVAMQSDLAVFRAVNRGNS